MSDAERRSLERSNPDAAARWDARTRDEPRTRLDLTDSEREAWHRHAREREAVLERERVAWVFGLTGGELADAPWTYPSKDGTRNIVHHYWYDGPPDWCASDYRDRWDAEYRTVVRDVMFGLPDATEGWSIVAHWMSSGETECPCAQADHVPGEPDCPLCDGGGYIYIGDGWAEVLFRDDRPDDATDATDKEEA